MGITKGSVYVVILKVGFGEIFHGVFSTEKDALAYVNDNRENESASKGCLEIKDYPIRCYCLEQCI